MGTAAGPRPAGAPRGNRGAFPSGRKSPRPQSGACGGGERLDHLLRRDRMTALRASAGLARDQVVTVGAADRIEPRQWDRLARRGFHLHHWFTSAERSGWNPRHVAVRGAEGLQAIVPAYLAGASVPHDLHHRWLGPLRGVSSRIGLNLRPVISVQPPFSLTSEPLGDFE